MRESSSARRHQLGAALSLQWPSAGGRDRGLRKFRIPRRPWNGLARLTRPDQVKAVVVAPRPAIGVQVQLAFLRPRYRGQVADEPVQTLGLLGQRRQRPLVAGQDAGVGDTSLGAGLANTPGAASVADRCRIRMGPVGSGPAATVHPTRVG